MGFTEFADKCAANVTEARMLLATAEPRSRAVNNALCDIKHFDKAVGRGALATFAGELDTALAFGGLADVKYSRETVDDVRAALRAYGEWLIQVADKAWSREDAAVAAAGVDA